MARQQKLVWRPTVVNVALSLTAVPIAFIFNKGAKQFRPEVIFVLASLILGAIVFALKRAIPAQPKIFYGFALFAFTSVADLLIPLEIDGFVTNFMDMYLQKGEPYLFSPWGAIVAYWDGTFNLLCYILMGYYVSNGLSYRNLAIIYSSNILNSMIVLLMGAFLSHTGLHWCTLMNIPYILLPVFVLWTAIAEPQIHTNSLSPRRRVRLLAVLLLLAAAVFNFIRGLSSLGSRVAAMSSYRESVEPIINQKVPAPFAAVQGIVGLFYFVPAYIIMAIAIHCKSIHRWVKDLAMVTSGAALQAEVSLLGMSLHPMTLPEHRLSPASSLCSLVLHCAAHLLTLGAPLLVAGMFCCPALAQAEDAKGSGKAKKDKEGKVKSKEKKDKKKEKREKREKEVKKQKEEKSKENKKEKNA